MAAKEILPDFIHLQNRTCWKLWLRLKPWAWIFGRFVNILRALRWFDYFYLHCSNSSLIILNCDKTCSALINLESEIFNADSISKMSISTLNLTFNSFPVIRYTSISEFRPRNKRICCNSCKYLKLHKCTPLQYIVQFFTFFQIS